MKEQITFGTRSIYNKRRIDVVLQATGSHAWNMSEGWINTLRREGLLNRAFKPSANWEDDEPTDDDGLYEYLKHPQADLILLLGFDWHSQPLHKTEKWRDRWLNAGITKIAILNEQCSAEPVQKSLQWQQLVSSALDSSIFCVDAIICNHEPDVEFLRNRYLFNKPITFQPFAIDTDYFRSSVAFQDRIEKAFFRGRIANFYNSDSYNKRKLLAEYLIQCKEVCLKGYEEKLSLEAYINDLNQHQVLINLPSISLTLTARVFEALGCGGTLLQNSVIGNTSNLLFKDWEHLVYYDFNNPDDLVYKLKYLIKNPDLAAKIATKGNKLCHQEHSIQSRIQQTLQWVDNKFDSDDVNLNLAVAKNTATTNQKVVEIIAKGSAQDIKSPTIVLDGIFFQLNTTGIARVWSSLLKEWSISGFSRHIVVLDRNNTSPKFPGIRYRNIESYNLQKTGLDSQILQFICDEVDADLFVSTYYTSPISTPSVFMAYDMIPEVLKVDLKDPMWREKHYGILHACRYITISQNTADDLVRFFPFISKELVTVAHCGIAKDLAPINPEKIINFRSFYGIAKPYFLMVGTRLSVFDGYKNAILFFKALNQFDQRDKVAVLCVGGESALEPELAELARETTVYLLKLSDAELRVAYSGALALVYPSRYEGFGLPIAEAMACGCPVITCKNSSISEVAGEAAIYVNEYNVEEMVVALNKVLLPDMRQILIEQGLKQVKQFSWTKMANIIADVLITTVQQLQREKENAASLIWREFREIQAQSQSLAIVNPQERKIDEPSYQVPLQFQPIVDSNNKLFHDELYQLNQKSIQKHLELQEAKNELLSIQSSKYWQLRTAWFKLKKNFFPLISLVLGLNLIFLVNSIYSYQPISGIISWLHYSHQNLSLWLGISLLSIALILGIVGNFGFINSKILRLFRLMLIILGFMIMTIGNLNII